MKLCMNGKKFIRQLLLAEKLFKFKIQKCGQILCAHKPYFLTYIDYVSVCMLRRIMEKLIC